MSAPACPHCGATARAGAKFCAACGRELPPSCRFCGAALRPEARFCPLCGRATAPTEHITPLSAAPPARRMAIGRRWAVGVALAVVLVALAALLLWQALQFRPVRTTAPATPNIAATLTAAP